MLRFPDELLVTECLGIQLINQITYIRFICLSKCHISIKNVKIKLAIARFWCIYIRSTLYHIFMLRFPDDLPAKVALQESMKPVKRPCSKPKTAWLFTISK